MIRVQNYAPTRFRGAVRCGISEWPTHQSGMPKDTEVRAKCSRVVFGGMFGARRDCDLFVDLGPGECVDVDVHQLDALGAYQLPHVNDPAQFGHPVLEAVVNGTVVHRMDVHPIGFEVTAARLLTHCAARWDRLPFVDLWVEFVPGQRFARWELLITNSNPTCPDRVWEAPTEMRLAWSVPTALVVATGLGATTLIRQGETIAHGQARAFVGTAAWLPLDELERASSYAHAVDGVVAFETTMPSPIGLPLPELPKAFGSPLTWANRHLNRTRRELEGYAGGQLGVAPNSGQAGDQEDEGYAKGGEAVAEVGNVLPSYYVALGMARRPCHWITPAGDLIDPEQHPELVFDAGRPHWHEVVSPDRLGVPMLPTSLETMGWMGPDREHWFANRLWFALAATGSPLLQRLAEHQAQAFLFGETVRPNWSTSHSGAARGVGWTCLVVLNLLRLLKNTRLRGRVLARMVERFDLVLLPELEPSSTGTIRVMGRHLHTDSRSHLSPSYPFWWQTWQQAVGSCGLYMLGTSREIRTASPSTAERVQAMAERFAAFVVDHASTPDQVQGLKVWDNVGIRADETPLTEAEFVEGVGAHCSGMFRHWGQPLAFWVAAQAGHAGARAHYQRLRAEALEGNRDLAWLPPLA